MSSINLAPTNLPFISDQEVRFGSVVTSYITANGIVKALAQMTKQKQKTSLLSCITVLVNAKRTIFHRTLASLAMLLATL